MTILTIIYKIGKIIFIYKKYAHNLNQSHSGLLASYTQAKIMIIPIISLNFFVHQNNAIVQLAGRSLKQLSYYGDISFSYPPPINCKSLAYLINEIVQSNWIIMQNNNVV